MKKTAYAGYFKMGKKSNIIIWKKSQLKIQQTAFMLMAIFIFFVLAGIFFISVSMQGTRQEVTRLEREKAIATAASIVDSAEFTCGTGSLCLDADKLLLLSADAGMQDFGELWHVAAIKVRKVSPLSEQESAEDIECTKMNYPDCNIFSVYSNEDVSKAGAVSSFAALCRKENNCNYAYDKCGIGQINIAYRLAE